MPRQIISYAPGHDLRRQLIAADPAGFKTLAVPIQRNQGVLQAGTFIDINGQRAVIASQVEGVLAAVVDSDFPDPPNDLSGRIAIYTGGRFTWPAVRAANPAFVFDPVSINTLRTKGITFDVFRLWQPLAPRAVKMSAVIISIFPDWLTWLLLTVTLIATLISAWRAPH